MCLAVLSACMYVNMHMTSVHADQKTVQSLGTRVTDNCELQCGFSESKPSPVEQQTVP